MPERLARVLTMVLQAASAMPLPMCIRFRAEDGIAHAGGVGGKVVHGPLGNTACLPWFWRDGRQHLDRADESFTLPLFEERAGVCGPDGSRGCAASKDRVGHVPHVFFGMIEIKDLHGSWKVFGGQIPDPRRAVAHDHHLLGLLQPALQRQLVEQPVKAALGRAARHIAHTLLRWRIHIHERRPALTASAPALRETPLRL